MVRHLMGRARRGAMKGGADESVDQHKLNSSAL